MRVQGYPLEMPELFLSPFISSSTLIQYFYYLKKVVEMLGTMCAHTRVCLAV